jgi:hypothetical protein
MATLRAVERGAAELQMHFNQIKPWQLLTLCILNAVIIRSCLGVNPHSGAGNPPMFGDFEAQRHWLEVATNLPLGEWYINTTRNNLQYWGLDYPPLTAYHSWLMGRVAAVITPATVAWETSRGEESEETILFMRATALFTDLLVYIPAAVWYAWTTRHVWKAGSNPHAWILFSLILCLLPGVLLVDHGHFQYNGASLGLALASTTALVESRYLLSSLFFCLALNYKHMLLYYAPVFFVFILGECISGGYQLILHGNTSSKPVSWASAAAALGSVGSVVSLTFMALWAPFCLFPPDGMTCTESLLAVVSRLFPVDRSLFEDKVSNNWCVLDVFTRFRNAIYDEKQGIEAGAISYPATRHFVVRLCTACTLAAMIPFLLMLFRFSTKNEMTPLQAEETVDSTPKRPQRATSKSRRGSSPSPSARRRVGRVERRGEERGEEGRRWIDTSGQPSTTAAAAPGSNHTVVTKVAGPSVVLPLALLSVSLIFFLFSYQVHEKTILLCIMPAALLYPAFPLLSLWMSVAGTLSMWPLLCAKDGLTIPFYTILAMCTYPVLPSHEEVAAYDASALASALQLFGCTCLPSIGKMANLLVIAAVTSTGAIVSTHAMNAWLMPPARLPDLFPYLAATASCATFIVISLLSYPLLWGATQLPPQTKPTRLTQ